MKVIAKVESWNIAAAKLKEVIPNGDLVLLEWLRILEEFSQKLDALKAMSNPVLKVT